MNIYKITNVFYTFIWTYGQQIRVPEITKLENVALSKAFSFKILNTTSLITCMEYCLIFNICQSVSVSRQCRLNVGTSITASAAMLPETNAVHVNKNAFPQIFGKGCLNHTCDSVSGCVNDGHCVPVFYEKFCLQPRTVLYGRSNYTTPVPVGGIVTYTCDPGYPEDGVPEITCMDEQKWSHDENFLCKYSIEDCEIGWIQNEDTCYFISLDQKNRSEAKGECEKLSASLLAIETVTENNYIANTLHSQQDNFMYWINGHDYDGGIWKYDNGDVISFLNWHPYEPDRIGVQHCIALRQFYGFLLSNDHCHESRKFICEKRAGHIPYNGS